MYPIEILYPIKRFLCSLCVPPPADGMECRQLYATYTQYFCQTKKIRMSEIRNYINMLVYIGYLGKIEWGSGGRWFKSSRPDQKSIISREPSRQMAGSP
jgi:hypothetical protein